MSPNHFTPSTVISSENSGPDTKLITLRVVPHLIPARGDHSPTLFAPIWSVYIKDDDIQVERPYTPIQGIDDDGRLIFWVKKYPHGEVGRWLHSKHVGDQVELRGPLTTWAWKEDEWDEVVMVSPLFYVCRSQLRFFAQMAGGTGITPFFQLFHSSIASKLPPPKTRFTLLLSGKTPADLPPPEILQPLASYATSNPEQLRLHLFVDSLDNSPSIPVHDLPQVQVGRINKAAIQRCLGLESPASPWWRRVFSSSSSKSSTTRKVLFLVCGPDQ